MFYTDPPHRSNAYTLVFVLTIEVHVSFLYFLICVDLLRFFFDQLAARDDNSNYCRIGA